MRQLSVVLGPERQPYLHDGHHYAVALCRMGIERAGMVIVDDLSHLNQDAFWLAMAQRYWVRPIDGMGIHRPIEHLPANVLAMQDDPFRSLAGAVRRLGGYVKTDMPYADFVWADFLRSHIARTDLDGDFEAALNRSMQLAAEGKDVRHLPGWQGSPETGAVLPISTNSL